MFDMSFHTLWLITIVFLRLLFILVRGEGGAEGEQVQLPHRLVLQLIRQVLRCRWGTLLLQCWKRCWICQIYVGDAIFVICIYGSPNLHSLRSSSGLISVSEGTSNLRALVASCTLLTSLTFRTQILLSAI